MYARSEILTLGFVHLSLAELTKVIAIFYVKNTTDRLLNTNKTTTKQLQDA